MNEELKTRFNELLMSTGRKGMDRLIKYMEDNRFYTAPCSSQYHLCCESGLLIHSMNVYETMNKVYVALEPKKISYDNVIIASLLHDIGKTGQFEKPLYVPNILKSGKVSDSKPYMTNPELLSIPHEIRTIQIAEKFISLTELENHALLYHNSLYGDLKYAYNGHETTLSMLLHFADLYCAKEIEKEVLF